MPRPEKVQAVAEIKERLSDAEAVFIAEYSGLTVTEQQRLRRGLKAAGSEFRVVKMTLARRAASELGHDGLLEMLIGPTGLAFSSGDAATVAKVLRDFSRDHARLVVKGALLGGEVLLPERVAHLADLEPREVLLARVAGVLQAPLATMAGLLAAMPRALASMVQQLIERAPEAADAPTDEPTADAEAATAVAASDEGAEGQEAAEEAPPRESPEVPDDDSDDETADPAEEE